MPTKHTNGRLIVHMVGNAHLDPAWLWTWPAGVDEALATCRSACDLLDEYPRLHVTRGEAWVHDQVRRLDPALFKRIAGQVKAGRWHVVNGWWVQPDCNLPTPGSFLKQAEIGGTFFRKHLGIKVTVGYNVDSFGHCAMLPTVLRRGGQDSYVFMRPMAGEMTLPANLFRWQSPVGDTVTAFRIDHSYGTSRVLDLKANVDSEIAAANRSIGHTMCFYGVGDHGGGPTREQIDWIAANRRYGDDVELRFSHPRAFFDAVRKHVRMLPTFEGELHYHAVGCYSVVWEIKHAVREAESLVTQASRMAEGAGVSRDKRIASLLDEAWRLIVFNQFHDVLGGSSISAVYKQALDELGRARSIARDLLVELSRKANASLPPHPRQRIVIDNPSDRAWQGLAQFSPWLPNDGASPSFVLLGEDHAVIPSQSITVAGSKLTLFPVDVPTGGRRVISLRRKTLSPDIPPTSRLDVAGNTLSNKTVSATVGPTGISELNVNGQSMLGAAGIRVEVIEDLSDAWSARNAGRFEGAVLNTFSAATPWSVHERGPLRATLANTFKTEDASLVWRVSLVDGETALRMSLTLHWRGRNRMVKLVIPPGFTVRTRRDGTPGAFIARNLDGKEYPVMDAVSVAGAGASLTAVSPDIYAADVRPDGTIRLTLLRCPLHAPQDPAALPSESPCTTTDQGLHEYEITLLPARQFSGPDILDEANRLNHPLLISETTRGMPAGWRYDAPTGAFAGESGTPLPPAGALLAEDLNGLLRKPKEAALIDSGTICPRWIGERLLVTTAKPLRINVPVPIEAKYQITVACAAGAGYSVHVLAGGQLLGGSVATRSRRPEAVVVSLATPMLAKGTVMLDLRPATGDRAAVGFIHVTPISKDIPSGAWRAVGPFLYGDNGGTAVGTVMRDQGFAPELKREFSEPVNLGNGTSAPWQPVEGEDGYVDFFALTGKRSGNIHYAVTRIHAATRCMVRFSYGVDFWIRIWLNGTVVVDFATPPSSFPGKGQLTFDAALEEGWNEVFVKVASGSGGNGFWMAVSDNGRLRFDAPSA